MVKAVGFTSSRDILGYESAIVEALKILPFEIDASTTFVTGGCIGGDALIGRTMARLCPDNRHVVHVPANTSRVEAWWNDPEFKLGPTQITRLHMPEGTTYRDRNQKIVEDSDVLVVIARFPEDHGASKRSGTWQTKRIAEMFGVPIYTYVLEKHG